MLSEQIRNYRDIITLKDGVSVLLRPMVPEDCQGLVDLFSPVSNEDFRYLRDDVRDPTVIETWCKNLDYSRVLPLLAVVKDQVVGQATLHFRHGPKRHLGEVRIFLAKSFRQRGLGTRMLNKLIDLARRSGLHILVAEVVADQSKVIKAFQNLGFELRATYEDYFMLPDGDTRDVAVLFLKLRPRKDDF
jgi:RimJ/RimL family protein N-acetyltransferase